MKSIKTFLLLFCGMISAFALKAQIFEHTYSWGTFDHSAWKIAPQPYQGYVIVGGKFFEPANTSIYMTQFDEFGQAGWTRTNDAAAAGFSQLDVFWKSFCVSSFPSGYFIASSGTRGGTHQYYTVVTNQTGQKIYERYAALPEGITFGGVCPAANGGYIAVGGNNSGMLAAVKFNAYGELQWYQTYPVSGFGWTVQQANGGGYVIGSTSHTATRIDGTGALVWSTSATPPTSPDGSAYTYSEFEEITILPDGQGFVMTGSTFSNSTSAVYIARFSWSGSVSWIRIPDTANTSLAGTPVAWTNSAIVNSGNEIVTSWRKGPVSTGGTLYIRKYDFAGTATSANLSLGNTIPVQEAFFIKPHGKFVIGGTRGSYQAAYSCITATLPTLAPPAVSDGNMPDADAGTMVSGRTILNGLNGAPIFGGTYNEANPGETNPASRVFYTDLRVFPNPASDGFINVGGKLEPGAQLRVVSTTGQIVAQSQVRENDSQIRLDLSGVAKGLYLVQMIGQENTVTKKIVVE